MFAEMKTACRKAGGKYRDISVLKSSLFENLFVAHHKCALCDNAADIKIIIEQNHVCIAAGSNAALCGVNLKSFCYV